VAQPPPNDKGVVAELFATTLHARDYTALSVVSMMVSFLLQKPILNLQKR
jgi:hypothetical protein